jgi:hypothetical protein
MTDPIKRTLGQKQELLSRCLAKLIIKAEELGYTIRLGDAFAKLRNPLEHKFNSQHYNKCAVDVNLFKDGVWLTKTEDHAVLGAYWESLDPECRWGGRFKDGNHYQIDP